MTKPKKVIILGSGALKIGQAGEFDYSGSQAIKALKEEGIEVVLINPNIATVQTDPGFADRVYFLPVIPFFVEKIIEKEQPDGILLSFGGQTALNCGLALDRAGILDKNGVEVLGTPVETIDITEDREKFNKALSQIKVKYPKSIACTNIKESLNAAEEIGYPVMVRAAFTLGGQGSGFANGPEELKMILQKSFSVTDQVIIEENLKGWKELEYEVVRDYNDNCITVCNMENFDPMGIHTGESIVVAPSQTLSHKDYHLMRSLAIKTVRHLGVVGECNIQFAYEPESYEYRVIEVNARLSRSSALASKATGYPLAYVAAKLGLGYKLPEISNSITKVTKAMFEPALDYVVCKYPRWDLQKFELIDKELGSEMKSVGEVMSIGRSIEEVFQKAIRSLEIGAMGLTKNEGMGMEFKLEGIGKATPKRLFRISNALYNGVSVDEIYELTKIDKFFLEKIKNVIDTRIEIERSKSLTIDLMDRAKKQGFTDKQIGLIKGESELKIREKRKKMGILPVIKQIDTLGAEFPAQTNYLYTTYHGTENDIDTPSSVFKQKILVLGSGSYRIGSSVEFDWCSVNTVKTLKKLGYETIILNYNPETVSTDYDISDKLYFDEISLEKILDIYEFEKPMGVIISMGGQVANNLAVSLKEAGVKVLGTDPNDIDRAENRYKFSAILDKIGVNQPEWKELIDLEGAIGFAEEVGYPVLIRPSYVLSGANMRVCLDHHQLKSFLTKIADISKDHPAVISKFELGAKEIEIDGVASKGDLVIYAITEHIENAGIHSGDATVVLPPQKLYLETIRKIKLIMKRIIWELRITGPFNIQFLAKNNKIKVIECNLRSSRSFPFVSKVTKYNFIEIATKAILGMNVSGRYNTLDLDYVGVKAAQFSFGRLKGADPRTGVEMASTGEVGCFGKDLYQAFMKAMLAVGGRLPKKNILVTIGEEEDKMDFLYSMRTLMYLGYNLFTTKGTHDFYNKYMIKTTLVNKISENKKNNTMTLMESGKIDFVINGPNSISVNNELTDGYMLRRKAIDLEIPLINNVKIAKLFVESIEKLDGLKGIGVLEYGEY